MDGRQTNKSGESTAAATQEQKRDARATGAGEKTRGISTIAVHAGEPRPKFGNALATPIVQTATYTFTDTRELRDHFEGRIEREEYGRYGNPTQRIAEQKLAALEGAGDCLLFASGMAAVTTTLYAVLSHNSHVVVTDDSYRRTRQFLTQVLHRYGVEVSVAPAGDYEAMEDAIRPTTRVLISESPTNPYNYIVDLERFADIARRHRVKTLIDATFATPFNQRPLEFGIDLVLHSATKYLGGHNDLLAGAVLGSTELVDGIRSLQAVTGAIVDPFVAYLLVRGLKTFALRIERQNANAQALAEFLAVHPRVWMVDLHLVVATARRRVARGLADEVVDRVRAPAAAAVGVHAIRRGAPQLGQGKVGRLAGEVPERDVEGRHGVPGEAHTADAPIRAVHPVPEPANEQRVLADEQLGQAAGIRLDGLRAAAPEDQ